MSRNLQRLVIWLVIIAALVWVLYLWSPVIGFLLSGRRFQA